jgi:alkylation response protein AidB-like acyl-CoA dehydrogenase
VNFDLSDDQLLIKRTAREFLAARYKLDEVRRLALEEERGFTDEQWEEMAGLGWPELAVPEEQEGQGLGAVELTVLAEELGYALAPTPLQSTWAAALLLAAAGEAGRLGGGRRGTVAVWDEDMGRGLTEPTLVLADGRLTGAKIAVPDAGAAELIVAVTAGGGHALVETDAAGVSLEPAEALDTTRRYATVRFDGAEAQELTGDFEPAWQRITVATAAESVGVAQRALEMAVAYAKERTQFDRPIGSYQAISHRCAQMLLEVEGARSVVLWAAWTIDHEPETASVAVSAAKAYASDCCARVTGAAIQVHGGIGFTWEHDLHFFFKRAWAIAHAYGDGRFHRDVVAAVLLD